MAIQPISNSASYNSPNFTGLFPKKSTIKAATAVVKEGMDKGWDSFIENGVIKRGIKPFMDSKFASKFADKTSNVENMPAHMTALGSFVTTAFYVWNTHKKLNKDEEQKKRARTLELNQILVTAVSTGLSYGANGLLTKMSKDLGYKFRAANQGHPKLNTRMKGFDIAKQLLIFTTMYRFVAPVFVTPLASKATKVWDNLKAQRAEKEQQNNVPQALSTKA